MLLSIIWDKVISKVYQILVEQSENLGIILKVVILWGLLFFYLLLYILKIVVYWYMKDLMKILCVVFECLYKFFFLNFCDNVW